jgi:hypothetical protein
MENEIKHQFWHMITRIHSFWEVLQQVQASAGVRMVNVVIRHTLEGIISFVNPQIL